MIILRVDNILLILPFVLINTVLKVDPSEVFSFSDSHFLKHLN